MKEKLLIIALISFCHSPSWATNSPQPEKCPSPSAIAMVGINSVMQVGVTTWFASSGAGSVNYPYDTKEMWSFFTREFEANNEKNAFNKGAEIVSTMKLEAGPFATVNDKGWQCAYRNAKGQGGSAFTYQE